MQANKNIIIDIHAVIYLLLVFIYCYKSQIVTLKSIYIPPQSYIADTKLIFIKTEKIIRAYYTILKLRIIVMCCL